MDPDPPSLERSLLALEGRVRALEQTIAVLQDTRQIEQRITERVAAQIPHVPVAAVVDAISSRPLPPAVKSVVEAAAQPGTLKQVARSSWLAFDMAQELVTVGRMLLDPRYHTAWITRFFVIAFAVGFVLSSWWVPLSGAPIIGFILDKVAG